MIFITSLSYSQCTILDLADSTKNKIIRDYFNLQECYELRELDSNRIIDLKLSNELLHNNNVVLNTKLVKQRRTLVFISIGSLVGGIWLGTRLK